MKTAIREITCLGNTTLVSSIVSWKNY